MGETRATGWLLGGLGALLLGASLSAPVNHDESQYVAAIALMRDGLPFRDWPYLQTPLQPLLLSPLSLLPAGWLLVAARLANVIFATITCWALLRLIRGRTPFWAAAAGAIGLATTNAFLFGAEVARNDMLPVMFLMLGLLAFGGREGALKPSRAAAGGLALGLAISAKISLALPAAGVGLWLLWRARAVGKAPVLAALAGGVTGLLPGLVLYALAPEAFLFGVFTYSLEAPQQFWTNVGMGAVLTPSAKLAELWIETAKGATLVALLVWLARLKQGGAERRLLDLAIAGGLLAAYLPDPFFRQYLIPLLPPLFARAALALPQLPLRWRRIVLGAGALSAVAGASGSLAAMAKAVTRKPPLFQAVERGRAVAGIRPELPLVTLSPEQFAGADVRLHPGFATGPFLFRTHGDLARRTAKITGAPTSRSIGPLPPARIVTGGERKPRPPLFPLGVDAPLDRYAAAQGYLRHDLGDGWVLWLPPPGPARH